MSNTVALILGSLPGRRSLEERQYYAQPRNSFWRIMGELFDAGPELAYAKRIQRLGQCGIALWDVVASAERPGSLDSSIVEASVEINDFYKLFKNYPHIQFVYFNGAKAAKLFEQRVLPILKGDFEQICYERLPSTSPANAAICFEEKLSRWSSVKLALER